MRAGIRKEKNRRRGLRFSFAIDLIVLCLQHFVAGLAGVNPFHRFAGLACGLGPSRLLPGLAAARSPAGSNMPPACYSIPAGRYATPAGNSLPLGRCATPSPLQAPPCQGEAYGGGLSKRPARGRLLRVSYIRLLGIRIFSRSIGKGCGIMQITPP